MTRSYCEQQARFVRLISDLQIASRRFEWIHASSSGGLILENEPCCNVVRAGLLVYGVVPEGKRLESARGGASFSARIVLEMPSDSGA